MANQELWVILKSPKDHPGKFVARQFLIAEDGQVGEGPYCLAETLEMARSFVPEGLMDIPRDDPVIVEVWV